MLSKTSDARKLHDYAPSMYPVASVDIKTLPRGVRRGRVVEGRVFVYAGGTGALMGEVLDLRAYSSNLELRSLSF